MVYLWIILSIVAYLFISASIYFKFGKDKFKGKAAQLIWGIMFGMPAVFLLFVVYYFFTFLGFIERKIKGNEKVNGPK